MLTLAATSMQISLHIYGCAKCYKASDVLKTPRRQNRLDTVRRNDITWLRCVSGDSANPLTNFDHVY